MDDTGNSRFSNIVKEPVVEYQTEVKPIEADYEAFAETRACPI
jgi:hypothetical protein